MAKILKGKEVIDSLNEELRERSSELVNKKGINPTLGIIRLGERPDDLAYERGAMKRAEKTGVNVEQFVFDQDMTQDELLEEIDKINHDENIHGVLMFRPLPGQIDDDTVRNALAPEKDMDGITDVSMAAVYAGTDQGYPPCTAEACMQILDYYEDMMEITSQLNELFVFYNGPKCGASAPDHMHFQAGSRGVVPLERDWKTLYHRRSDQLRR